MKAKILKLSLLSLLLLFALAVGFVPAMMLTSYNLDLKDKELALIKSRESLEHTPEKIILDNTFTYNNLRKSLDLQPSIKDENLCKFSDERLKDVATNWTHDREKIDAYARNNKLLYKVVAENLNYGPYSSKTGNSSAVIGWISSKPHFQAMINPNYTRNCMSCSKDRCVLIMAQPQNP